MGHTRIHNGWGEDMRLGFIGLVVIIGIAGCAGGSDEPFVAASSTAMKEMMKAMAIRPSGDADRDFVALMVPHHEGAIAIAQAELRYGESEQLRRMAQEIVVTQQQEIAAMRMALR
jgi:uncharacterized protein (DUF305 family)